MLILLRKLTVLGLTLGWALIGAPVLAETGTCGSHLDDDLVGNYSAHLYNGMVFGRPIPNADSPATLWMQDDVLSFRVEGGGMQGKLEFPLKRVSAADQVPFNAKTLIGKNASLQDMAVVTGCDTIANLPQYFGRGYWVSADGKTVPATLRMFIWMQPENGGIKQGIIAVGVMRSDILNGMILVQE